MHPRERIEFSPIDKRPPLALPDGLRLIVWPLLALEELPRPDAADALALAITHCRRGPVDAAVDARRSSALPKELLALFGKRRRSRRGVLGSRRPG